MYSLHCGFTTFCQSRILLWGFYFTRCILKSLSFFFRQPRSHVHSERLEFQSMLPFTHFIFSPDGCLSSAPLQFLFFVLGYSICFLCGGKLCLPTPPLILVCRLFLHSFFVRFIYRSLITTCIPVFLNFFPLHVFLLFGDLVWSAAASLVFSVAVYCVRVSFNIQNPTGFVLVSYWFPHSLLVFILAYSKGC